MFLALGRKYVIRFVGEMKKWENEGCSLEGEKINQEL